MMSKEPYLQITLEKLGDVPDVIFKGEKINLKREILLHWETDTDEYGGTTVKINHHGSNGYPTQNKVEERIKGHIENSPIHPNN